MVTIDFDVNIITKITFSKSHLSSDYEWKSASVEPKYKKILWWKKQIGVIHTEAGFYVKKCVYYGNDFWVNLDEYFLSKHYIIKTISSASEELKKEIWTKPYVEVKFGHDQHVSRKFDSDDEAKEWVDKLKKMCDKKFETIEV